MHLTVKAQAVRVALIIQAEPQKTSLGACNATCHATITIAMLHKLVCIAQTQGHIATADFTAQAKARAGQKNNMPSEACMAVECNVHN